MHLLMAKMKLAGLNTAFFDAIKGIKPPWEDAVTKAPSGKSVEDYGWLGDVPQMAEWKDELIPEGIKEYGYTLKNKRFAAAMKVYNDDLADDQYGQAKLKIASMAPSAAGFPGTLVSALRTGGETGLAYDGTAFFSAARAEGSNLVTGTGTSDAQIAADFESALVLIRLTKTDKGQVFDRTNMKLTAVCGVAMEQKLRRVLLAATVSTGGVNMLSGLVAGLEVDPYITGNSWYLEDRDPYVKGFIVQEREAVDITNTGMDSDQYVLHDRVVYRVKWRGNAGYGLWQHAVKVKN
ncbi:hypothetical protein CVU37_15095 [candidate division BRC1 bacterium HGW-BRC1-1]|jgi:phage major head subunit gpT-like protein|nr:MAG: hypothetical protein CVU37_15095 [candidate division BRC1 bacterium HGW-BRC1-1]